MKAPGKSYRELLIVGQSGAELLSDACGTVGSDAGQHFQQEGLVFGRADALNCLVDSEFKAPPGGCSGACDRDQFGITVHEGRA